MDNSAFIILDERFDKSKNVLKKAEIPPNKVYSFEEAANLIGTGKFHYFLTLVCGLCFMTSLVETMGISMLLPFLKCDLSSTISEEGFLASSGFIGIVISSHAMGFLADTWGRIKTLRTALIFSFLTTVISAFSINIWILIAFRFFNGVAISACQSSVISFLGEFHGHRTRTRYVTILTMSSPIGLIFLPSVATGILPLQFDVNVMGLNFTPWRVFLLANSLLSLIALSGFCFLPESPKYDLIQGRTEIALQTFRMIFKWNSGRPESEYPVKQVHIDLTGANLSNIHGLKEALALIWSQTIQIFSKNRILQTMNICGVMFVTYATVQGTTMWFPTMLDQIVAKSKTDYLVCEIMAMHGKVSKNATISETQCGGPVSTGMFQILIFIGVVFLILYLIITFSVEIIGKKNFLTLWISIAAACSLIIQWARSYILSTILLTLIMATGCCAGIMNAISTEYFPTNINAMAMSFIMMVGRLGAAVGSNFVGVALFTNCNMLFNVYFGTLAIIALCSVFLPKNKSIKNCCQE